MHRTRHALIALAGTLMLAGRLELMPATASASQAPAKSSLAAAVKGPATVAYTKPTVKRQGALSVTTFKFKNTSSGPIAGLKIHEYWFDNANRATAGEKFVSQKPVQPGEIVDVTIKTATIPGTRSSLKWSHAYGDVNASVVPAL